MSELKSVIESTSDWALQRAFSLRSEAQTGSTNDDAKAAALLEDTGFVLYLSAHQSAGRGRGSNSWLDTGHGESLLSTWSFAIPLSPQAVTSARIGLSLFRAVTRAWPSLSWSLKAPNDLFLNGLKCAGLLIETVSNGQEHRLLVGLGLNVLAHPRGLAQATHLGESLSGGAPRVDEWFRFLDEWKAQLTLAMHEIVQPELTVMARQELTTALNANPNKPFHVLEVSPQGDLISAGGLVRWIDL